MSTLVSENIEIVLPDGVDEESVEIVTSPEGTTEAVSYTHLTLPTKA